MAVLVPLPMSQKHSPKGHGKSGDPNLKHTDSWARRTLGHRPAKFIGARDPSTRGPKPGMQMPNSLKALIQELEEGIEYFNKNRPPGQRVGH